MSKDDTTRVDLVVRTVWDDVTGAVLGALFGVVAGCKEFFAGYQSKSVFAEGDAFSAILKYAAAWIMIAVGTETTVGTTAGTAVGNIRQVSRSIGAAMHGGIIAAIL